MVLIMGWHRTGDKPLSESMMALFTDANMLCVVRSQRVNEAFKPIQRLKQISKFTIPRYDDSFNFVLTLVRLILIYKRVEYICGTTAH